METTLSNMLAIDKSAALLTYNTLGQQRFAVFKNDRLVAAAFYRANLWQLLAAQLLLI